MRKHSLKKVTNLSIFLMVLLGMPAAIAEGAAEWSGATPFESWDQGQNAIPMGSRQEWKCFLVKIGGDFEGDKEQVYVKADDDVWELGGSSNQDDVSAEAYCVPYSAEVDFYSIQLGNGLDSEDMGSRSGRFCALIWVQGKFQSANDFVKVYHTDEGGGDVWKLEGQSSQNGYARAMCFEIPYDELETASWNLGDDRTDLGSAANRICALNRMQGKFNGKGEYIMLSISEGNWYLDGGAKDADMGVQTVASCMTF